MNSSSRKLTSLVFAGIWVRYEVTRRKPAQKTFQHSRVGPVTLTSPSLHLDSAPGRRIGVCTAEPGGPDHGSLLPLDNTAPATDTGGPGRSGTIGP